MTDTLTPVLTADWGNDRAWTLKAYEQSGGYQALKTALEMDPTTSSRWSRTRASAVVAVPDSRPA